MHACTASELGIAAEQRRKASPVQALRSAELPSAALAFVMAATPRMTTEARRTNWCVEGARRIVIMVDSYGLP
jgi:hypothetical protein